MIDQPMRSTVKRLAIARDRLLEERPAGPGLSESFVQEAAVLSALGIEIGFKAMIYDANGLDCFSDARALFPKGPASRLHNLQYLFRLLRDEERAAIFAYFQRRGPQKWEFQFNAHDEDALAIAAKHLRAPPNFDDLLALAADTFDKFRYAFEKTNIGMPTTFLWILLDAVVEVLGPDVDRV